ncbi:hypothetical protein P7C70_g7180, partial [Phenoliferia sp. Uapishka_3]
MHNRHNSPEGVASTITSIARVVEPFARRDRTSQHRVRQLERELSNSRGALEMMTQYAVQQGEAFRLMHQEVETLRNDASFMEFEILANQGSEIDMKAEISLQKITIRALEEENEALKSRNGQLGLKVGLMRDSRDKARESVVRLEKNQLDLTPLVEADDIRKGYETGDRVLAVLYEQVREAATNKSGEFKKLGCIPQDLNTGSRIMCAFWALTGDLRGYNLKTRAPRSPWEFELLRFFDEGLDQLLYRAAVNAFELRRDIRTLRNTLSHPDVGREQILDAKSLFRQKSEGESGQGMEQLATLLRNTWIPIPYLHNGQRRRALSS